RLARHTVAALTALLVAVPAMPAAAAPAGASSAAAGPTERVLVAYDQNVVVPASASPAPVSARIVPLGVQVLDVPVGEVDDLVRRLEADPRVRWAEPDVEVHADVVTPNDPLWRQQWGPARIGVAAAWEHTTGSRDVTVAVLDSGVDPSHPDLRGAVLPGRSFVPGTTAALDDNGHGTSAAGIVAARGDNREGVAGVCWSCRILPVKVLDSRGSGTMSAVAAGLVWAADQGAQVASLSLSSTGTSQAIADAVAYARAKGMLVFASAGNTGTSDMRYPAGLPGVISVAGTTSSDARYDWSTHGTWVDLAAPGCNLTTRSGGGYASFCGTSSATPLAAGAAALALSVSPAVSGAEVADALAATAAPVRFPLAGGRIRLDATVARVSSALRAAPGNARDDAPASTPATPPGNAAPTTNPARAITRACPTADAAPEASRIGVHGVAASCLDAWQIGIFPLDRYDPSRPLTRAEFAGLLARMLDATGRSDMPEVPARFSDVSSHPRRDAIQRLAGLGVIAGYGDGSFRPDQPIRRDQMATLMARVASGRYEVVLPTDAPQFLDVAKGTAHGAAIGQLAASGVTTGVGAGRYDPAGLVTRGQTATFAARLLDLLIAEGRVAAQTR
ncbi:MAG: S8 family serine peptidase, partial [Actinobacteria bacterium]|nr:S8 family serine peptidase [Actinomycetota bacterium]